MNTPDPYVDQTRGLTKTFKGVQALKGLDLKVPKHSIFGFLGPNGAGKSTTIKLLLGLTRPTAGSATSSARISCATAWPSAQRVGYLAQDPRYYDHMTARETLRFTARFFYTGPRDADRRAHRARRSTWSGWPTKPTGRSRASRAASASGSASRRRRSTIPTC